MIGFKSLIKEEVTLKIRISLVQEANYSVRFKKNSHSSIQTFAARLRPFREMSTPTISSKAVGCSNKESNKLPDPHPKSTYENPKQKVKINNVNHRN